MLTALILAAGKGTRMKSSLSKVLHPVCGRSMVGWAVHAARQAGATPVVVVGHQGEAVRASLPGLRFAEQAEQLGTGHAVACAAEVLPREGTLIVLPGDAPLIRGATLRALAEEHAAGALCTVLTMRVPEPGSYGRIVRDEAGIRVVEAAHCTEAQLCIDEVNTGVYAFDCRWLLDEVIPSLKPHPPKGEIYLTDAVEAAGARLRALLHPDAEEMMGVNDKAALAEAEALLRRRINRHWMLSGVSMRDPACTYVDAEVELAEDVRLEPGVLLTGRTRLGRGVVVGAHCVLRDAVVEEGAEILPGTVIEGATVGPEAHVGPMARLREGTELGARVKVGNFVETKKAVFGPGAKASHLSYLGDCAVGAEANVGAGTITCNYDGWGKHRTHIGERAFIGSNTALVAPVTVGDGAIVGAGSVITRDVPEDALAIARGEQKNIEGRAPDVNARNKLRAGK